MSNKIFDIKPLGADENKINPIKEENIEKDQFFPDLRAGKLGGTRGSTYFAGNRKKAGLGVLALLVLAGCFGAYYFFWEHKVVIEIMWETKFVGDSTSVNVAENGDILGAILLQEYSASKEFPSTGIIEKKEKAQGLITVYNNYSTSDQPLLATTRFISDKGELFRIPKRVVVPGMGSVETTVFADQPCEEYNIKPSVFSIPGFAGTNKYTAFYAKSFSDFTGGYCGESVFVDEKDFEDAENFLKNEAFENGKEFLKQKREEGFIVLDHAIQQEVIEFTPLAKLNQEIDSFIAQIKIQTKAFAFKGQDLQDFVKEYIGEKISGDSKIHEQSLDVNWEFVNINLEGDEIELKIEMNCLTYVGLDKQELKQIIAGKDFVEISNILESKPEIRRAVVKAKPFWMKKAPIDFESIEIVDKF